MNLETYINARRVACEHDDEPPTIRNVSLVPGPNTIELSDCLLDELGDFEATLPNCDGIQ